MNTTVKRLLTFFIGMPLVYFIVTTHYFNYFIFHICVGTFTVFGASEFYEMLKRKYPLFSKDMILISTALLPFLTYVLPILGFSPDVIPWVFICELIIFMMVESFRAKTFENSLLKIAFSSLIILYCGFFMTFLARMSFLQNKKLLLLFLIFVFMCDSAAWFFGILWGKSTRGIVAASPNKSLVGFIGGIFGSVASGVLVKILFPHIFTCPYINLIIIGFLTSFAAIVGDLIESVIKRCLGAKDSGNIIPGRGGILDSIDSILIAAPIFYIAQHFLY